MQYSIPIPRPTIALAIKRALAVASDLNDIASPLQKLDIQNFSYNKYEKNIRILSLATNKHYLQVYQNNMDTYQDHEFSENALNLIQPGSLFFPGYPLPSSPNKILNDLRETTKTTNSIIFSNYNPLDQTIEAFFFCTDSNEGNWLHKLMSQIDYLMKFIFYFKDKGHKLIDKAAIKPHEIKQLLPDISQFDPILNEQSNTTTNKIVNSFHLNITQYELGAPFVAPLTQREIKCLVMIYIGLTAKQIAKALDISYRTVEKHLENIRHKANQMDLNVIRQKLSQNQLFLLFTKSQIIDSLK